MDIDFRIGFRGYRVGGAPFVPPPPPPPPQSTVADLSYFPIYGQSLSLGSDPDGGAVISATSATHRMFTGGVRVHYDQLDGGANQNAPLAPEGLASTAPLAEAAGIPIGAQFGETLASGIGAQISRPSLFAATGRGAYSVASLSRTANGVFVDANHYHNTYAAMLYAAETAEADGESFAIPAFLWKHGEADAAANTPRATYKTRVRALRDDLRQDAAAAAHLDGTAIPLVLDQLAFRQDGRAYGEIAVAAIELHRAGDAICVGPSYDAEFTDMGDVHMSSNGYREHGERWGLALETLMTTGIWHPCHITSATRVGATVTLEIHVPQAPLVLDTTTFASRAFTNHGFAYSGADITGVTITDDGTSTGTASIEITLDADAPGTLRYAYENASLNLRNTVGGHLRDSATETTQSSGRPLWNWLCTDAWDMA